MNTSNENENKKIELKSENSNNEIIKIPNKEMNDIHIEDRNGIMYLSKDQKQDKIKEKKKKIGGSIDKIDKIFKYAEENHFKMCDNDKHQIISDVLFGRINNYFAEAQKELEQKKYSDKSKKFKCSIFPSGWADPNEKTTTDFLYEGKWNYYRYTTFFLPVDGPMKFYSDYISDFNVIPDPIKYFVVDQNKTNEVNKLIDEINNIKIEIKGEDGKSLLNPIDKIQTMIDYKKGLNKLIGKLIDYWGVEKEFNYIADEDEDDGDTDEDDGDNMKDNEEEKK
jgi:hypothetical protein